MMVDSYKPYISGITNYVEINKRYLELAGHDVFVFTFGDTDLKDGEPRVVRSPGVPLSDSGFYLSMRYSRAAKKILQTMDFWPTWSYLDFFFGFSDCIIKTSDSHFFQIFIQ